MRDAGGTDILERAMAILTRETAAGYGASPPVSLASSSLPVLPGAAPQLDQLRQRAVEAVTNLLATATAAAGDQAAALGIPWRKASGVANPGDNVQVALTIDNPYDRPAVLNLYSTDLVSDSGYQIPAHAISFEPGCQTIAPRSQATSLMNVAVPLQAIAGSYSALVQGVGLAVAKAVITLDVV